MVVTVSVRNRLIWRVTSQQIREHWSVFKPYLKGTLGTRDSWDFGKGNEPAFCCPECGRYYPVFTATIDHAVPRSLIRIEYTDSLFSNWFVGNTFKLKRTGMISVIPFDTDMRALRLDYRVDEMRGIVQCYESFSPGTVVLEFSVDDLMENLRDNRQPMCAYCNSCKGNH